MSVVRPNRQEFIRLSVAVINDRGLGLILKRIAPHVGICPTCVELDFTHVKGCSTAARVEFCHDWLERQPGKHGSDTMHEQPWELARS